MNTENNTYDQEKMIPEEKHANMTFADVPAQVVGGNTDNSMVSTQTDLSLVKFLSRPIEIVNITDVATTSVFPWEAYLSNPAVVNKLENYKGIRATLNLRAVQAANPFVYGLMGWTYTLQNEDAISNVNIVASMASMGIYLDPSIREPQEMKIPHVWRYPYIDLRNANTIINGMRQGQLRNIILAPYRSANSVVPPGVQITIYAWLTDVELLNTTSADIVYQSEYQGVVSKPASIVANIAGKLADVPVIGVFAKATEIGSRALAAIASLFGYSKPVNIKPPMAMYNQEHRNLFTSTSLDVANKLTYDVKQENTIGPQYIIGDDGDALAFKNIARRPGLIRNNSYPITWQTTDVIGSILYAVPVSPGTYYPTTTSGGIIPPVGLVCLAFKYWRGTLVYRMRIVASQYHRGRLRVFWSPNPLTSPATSLLTNVVEACIIDISNNQTVDVEINWGAMEPFKDFGLMRSDSTIQTAGTWQLDQYTRCNGYIYVQVIQPLSAPIVTAPVNIVVEIFAGDDFAVAVPTNAILDVLHTTDYDVAGLPYSGKPYPGFDNNSGPIVIGDSTFPNVDYQSQYNSPVAKPIMKCTVNSRIGNSHDLLKMHIGEAFVSFRPMLKSYHLYMNGYFNVGELVGPVGYVQVPLQPVNTNIYQEFAQKLLVRRIGNIISYLSVIMALRRGGIRYKFQSLDQACDGVVTGFRIRHDFPYANGAIDFNDQDYNKVLQMYDNGFAITGQSKSPTLSIEVPYQLPDSFIKTVQSISNLGFPYSANRDAGMFTKFPIIDGEKYQIFVAGAEDMTFDWFAGSPTFRFWASHYALSM